MGFVCCPAAWEEGRRLNSQICSQQEQCVLPQMPGQSAKSCPRWWILTPEASHTLLVNSSALKLSQSQVKSSLISLVPPAFQVMTFVLGPFILFCLTLNLFPLGLGSSDPLSDGAVWGVGEEMRLGGFLHEPHTGKPYLSKGYQWLEKGGNEEFISVIQTPESPLTSRCGSCFWVRSSW